MTIYIMKTVTKNVVRLGWGSHCFSVHFLLTLMNENSLRECRKVSLKGLKISSNIDRWSRLKPIKIIETVYEKYEQKSKYRILRAKLLTKQKQTTWVTCWSNISPETLEVTQSIHKAGANVVSRFVCNGVIIHDENEINGWKRVYAKARYFFWLAGYSTMN